MSAVQQRRQGAEQLALVLTEHGMQRMSARVMAAFLFTEQLTLTQGELAEELGASAGSVSGAVKMLHSLGLVERVPAAGSRRDHFRLRDDAWAALFSSQNEAMEEMLAAARTGIEATGADSPARRRLEQMREFHEFVLAAIPDLIEQWQRRSARDS